MNWILASERIPTDQETVNGRVPILDKDGYLGYAVLAGPKGAQFLLSEFDVKYWLEAVPASPIKE